ncbi:tyrosine-type recombinase/integrase [Actinoplanes sp. NPDC051411]|uniref:tyrosine-type recombinase/integrase n=1 Tax=Actinoplanes sp. NPDC051411 TaxID=3155522 RepID=UPI00344450D9
MLREDQDRDATELKLERWGRVVAAVGPVPWLVVDPAGAPVEAIFRFFRDFVARGNRPGSVRSYAYALHRWWRFLQTVGVQWDKATSTETRDFVLWMLHTSKQRRARRTKSLAVAGGVNPITRKRYLDDSCQPRTIRHSNAVIRSFYDYWIEMGQGPLINPVAVQRAKGRRPNAHHNPFKPFRAEGRLRYNPPVPRQRVRAMPDERWAELFAALRSDRDPALLAITVSAGVRASELLGIRGADVDWGDQLVRVRRKGTTADGERGGLRLTAALLVDARAARASRDDLVDAAPPRPTAGRAVPRSADLRRSAGRLPAGERSSGHELSMHDLRHTCAIRMIRDERLSLRDVQTILGHAHLTTTQGYLEGDDAELFRRVREHLETRKQRAEQDRPAVAAGYDAADLAVLFGGGLQ